MLQKDIIEIAPRTWLISEYRLVNMYLLEGDDSALLIDCGAGIGNIAEDVKALTDKPLTVAITHAHADHDGGAMLFKEVYMHPGDIALAEGFAKRMGGYEGRKSFAMTRTPVRNPGVSAEEVAALVQPDGPVVRKPLLGGARIDLGGRTVEAIWVPGHSPGSLAFLDEKTHLLFVGDMGNDCVLVSFYPYTATLEVCARSFRQMWDRQSDYDGICQGHDALAVADKAILKDYADGMARLLRGEAQGSPDGDALHTGVAYRHGRALIWYDPEHLR